jgi:LysM repeat protein
MQKRPFQFLICLLFIALSSSAQHASIHVRDYIAKFRDIAIEEMKRTGVPASITLAQGIHESDAGRSNLVTRSNNHFGIKCKSDWKGESVSHDDDARGECFRKYDSPFQSYIDHSDFLKTRSHYAFLFHLDPTDYEAWAHGLKKAGYATNPKYPQILIKLIRDYNLQDYTFIALGQKEPAFQTEPVVTTTRLPQVIQEDKKEQRNSEEVSANYAEGVFRINDTKVVYVKKGTSFLAVANEYDISLARLFDFNDMQQAEIATRNQLIYLQRKRKKGSSAFHIVAKGESLHDIAQAEGIRLENLLEYNLLKEGMQPAAGEKLYLQEQATAMPRIATSQSSSTMYAAKQQAEYATESYTLHTVQSKETLYAISKKYSVTVDDIMQWNAMESRELKVGQQLRINTKINVNNQGTR